MTLLHGERVTFRRSSSEPVLRPKIESSPRIPPAGESPPKKRGPTILFSRRERVIRGGIFNCTIVEAGKIDPSRSPIRNPKCEPLRARKKRSSLKRGFVSQVGLQRFLLQSFKYYLYGGDVPCILAITDNLRAQVHMLRQAALEEAVIHHLSHVNGSADGSSTSL